MRRRKIKTDSTESRSTERFRCVLNDSTSISILNKSERSYCIIRTDLAKDYEIEVEASEAPIINKLLNDPEPYETSMAEIKILEDEIFPINEAIRSIFGLEKDMDLYGIKLAVGGSKNDYVTIEEKDLIKYDVKPTLGGLMDFIKDNNESIMGFLDREYITEEGNVIYLNCGKKNLSDNVLSIKMKILASMQQRGFFLQQDHKYYGLQLYLIIESRNLNDDKLLELLKELEIDWELIFFRRRLAIHDWTEIECEKNQENLKNYLRAKYESLNYFDINNITRLVVKNNLQFIAADKMASLLFKMKTERSYQLNEDLYSITLKKAEIAAAARLACAYLGLQVEIEFDRDIPLDEILKYEEELTNI